MALPNGSDGPVSKARQRRERARRIDAKAIEINEVVKALIAEGAKELDIDASELLARFALIAPLGETRPPNYYNGLISHYSKEWKSEYAGPPKEYLTYVAQRVRNEKLAENLKDEEISAYVEAAEAARAANKDTKAAGMNRKKAVSLAFAELHTIYQRILTLNNTVGVEFVLFVTRGALEDDVEPFYGSSTKAGEFMHGQVSMAPKDILQLMDLFVVGGGQGTKEKVEGEKDLYRKSVQEKLRGSLLKAAKDAGVDTSKLRHVEYKKYAKLVFKYKVVLRGYPLTVDRGMVRPSDFPGGIKGLRHADKQITSGKWGFEKMETSIYDEWKDRYEKAEDDEGPMPTPPYIEVPGSEYKKVEKSPSITTKRKATGGLTKKRSPKRTVGASAEGGNGVKSREFIVDSDDERDSDVLDESDEDEE
ncbi:hypothetical protein RSOL_504130, partial [Rhizoctonia solani AG-3 Rhs1AP]